MRFPAIINFASNFIIQNLTQPKLKTENMEKQTTFSFTGFYDDQAESMYKEKLIGLGCKYFQKLVQHTNVLIVNTTATQKFKIAKLYKIPIPCVTKKWVEDSAIKGHLLPVDKYLVGEKQLFLGTNVAVCGFSQQKAQKIQKIITEKGGKTVLNYKAIDIMRNYEQISTNTDIIHVVLASNEEIQRAKNAKFATDDTYTPSLVRIQWLEDSLKRKRCKFPNDYGVNLIKPKNFIHNAPKLYSKLKNFLENNDIMEKVGDFLEDTLVYIDKDFSSDFARLLKNLIAVCGGYWTDKFSSIVTHILATQVDEGKYKDFKKYGSRIHILRPEWLIDCIFLLSRLNEEDYFIRCFKIKDQILRNLLQEQFIRNNQNSQNFNSLPGFGDRRVSMSSSTLPLQLETQKKKASNQPKSEIFKGRNFYFPQQIIHDQHYNELTRMIRNAGGETYDKINTKMHVYVPLKDSPLVTEIKGKLIASKFKALVVSERWIKQCVKKNTFIEPNLKIYHNFRAFEFVTPLSDFHKFVFEVIGFDNLTTLRVRQLLTVFGSTKTNPNKAEVTHILCGQNWNTPVCYDKIKKIKQSKKNPQLINQTWLLECIKEKRTISCQNHLVQYANQPKTPEKKNEQHSQSSEYKTTQAENKSEIKLTP